EWNDVKHVIIIPTYNESVEVLTKALNSLKNQVNISKKNLIVVLGMEERAVKAGAKERAKTLLSMYKKEFGMMFDTYHPAGLPGEIPGKASNEAWAAKEAKKVMEKNGMNIKDATITSCDSDTIFDKNYFAALNYHFIKNPNRYVRFWQSTIFW